jgi:hypothetical protein
MPPAARTAIPTAPAAANVPPTRDTSLAELFRQFKQELLRLLNDRARYHHHPQCEEATTKKYDG